FPVSIRDPNPLCRPSFGVYSACQGRSRFAVIYFAYPLDQGKSLIFSCSGPVINNNPAVIESEQTGSIERI
ncbi:MAG: hypothetical protein L3J24_15120, partial [Xanthomonadales bacterium]|nr:hypothetical protein [Xanthomonadales bacterium]